MQIGVLSAVSDSYVLVGDLAKVAVHAGGDDIALSARFLETVLGDL